MTPATLERQHQHETAYAAHRGYVLAVLSRRCRWLEPDERESLLHDAWMILLEKERDGTLDVDAMRGPQIRAYLVQTALHRALAEGRRASRTRNEPLGDRDDFATGDAAPEDVVDAGFEGARVREIVAELSARQQTIVKLRFFFDRSPDEVQRLLGITERAYRRDLERAMKIVADGYTLVREGTFCASRASLIRAYVAGIAGPNRMQDARDHIATCPACRRFALELREATGKVAVLTPLPALAAGGGHARGLLAHVADWLSGPRDAAAHVAARFDPTAPALAAARPGAVVSAVAGCLALSGGAATYCAVAGLPAPIAAVVGHHHHHHTVAARSVPVKAPVRTTPVTAVATTTTPARAAAATPKVRKRVVTKREAHAARVAVHRKVAAKRSAVAAGELGLEGAGQATRGSGTASGATTAAVQAPKNAPPDEFAP